MNPDLNRRQREQERRRQAERAEGNDGNGQSELMEEVRPHDRGFAEDPVVDYDSGGAGIDAGSVQD